MNWATATGRDQHVGAQDNKDTVELVVERWNAHDDRYFDLYERSAPVHGLPPDLPPTVDGMKALFNAVWKALPDSRIDALSTVAEGDTVAVHLRFTGTHEGEILGAAPTGNRIEFTEMQFLRFGDEGKIAERWQRLDDIALLTQLGLMPAPAEAPA
jgi:predicted ester cyclase